MALQREHTGVGHRTASAFAGTLSRLKRNGCNLLVVGTDHDPTWSEACCRLLGYEGAEPRRRVVVTADSSVASVRDRLPAISAIPGGQRATIIDWQTPTRSASATAEPQPSGPRTVQIEANDLAGLGIEIRETLFGHEKTIEPGRLRLCFDSLTPLICRFDHETVFRFLHLVTGSVDRTHAMGHYHLPVGRNAEATRTVAPLFDAIVELRTESGHSEQRWHVPEEDLLTDWLPV